MSRESSWSCRVSLIFALGAACSDDGDQPAGSSDSAATRASSGVTSASSTGSSATGIDDSTLGPPTSGSASSGSSTAPPEGPQEGCPTADVLFVIDDSQSMESTQAKLVESFPEIVKILAGKYAGMESIHLGVVTSDAYAFNTEGCQVAGGLVTKTGGEYSSRKTCGPYAEGFNFMTSKDSTPSKPDGLTKAFSCAARVGTGGANVEKMMESATQAVSAEINADGACNGGFLRADSPLFVVLISDEDDPGSCPSSVCPGSAGGPAEWYAKFLAAKGGDPKKLIFLAIVRGVMGHTCMPPGAGSALRDGTRLMEFVDFAKTQGSIGVAADLCYDDYSKFVADTIPRDARLCPPPSG